LLLCFVCGFGIGVFRVLRRGGERQDQVAQATAYRGRGERAARRAGYSGGDEGSGEEVLGDHSITGRRVAAADTGRC